MHWRSCPPRDDVRCRGSFPLLLAISAAGRIVLLLLGVGRINRDYDEVELRPLPLLRPIARHHIKLSVFALEDAPFARRRGLLVLASKGILAQLVSPNQRRIVSRSSVTSRRYASLHVLLQNLSPCRNVRHNDRRLDACRLATVSSHPRTTVRWDLVEIWYKVRGGSCFVICCH
jgi:hypothetical protein